MKEHSRRATPETVKFRLNSPALGYTVDVRLSDRGDRWLAVGHYDGRREIAVGATPRGALTAVLAPLGAKAVTALLADPCLFAVSCTVHELTAAR